MIIPIWSAFKSTTAVTGRTMLCLHIAKESDKQMVQAELSKLDPQLLLFLRKLRHLVVLPLSRDNTLVRRQEFYRQDDTVHELSRTKLMVQSTDAVTHSLQFLVFRRTALNMHMKQNERA
jgi:hypothetical protein